MENLSNQQQSEGHFVINDEVRDYLIETSKWGKFLAIMGYIGMGFLILFGLFFLIGFSFINDIANTPFPARLFGLVYIIISAAYYFPSTYLYKFSTHTKQGLLSNNHQSITSGFENLKSLSKFMGIFTIVTLSIYVLVMIALVPIFMLTAKGQMIF